MLIVAELLLTGGRGGTRCVMKQMCRARYTKKLYKIEKLHENINYRD